MNGLPLFNIPETPPKQVDPLSRGVYREIVLPTLNNRQLMVLQALAYYVNTERVEPTACELLEFMRRWRPELDVNNVRPRLTDLHKADLRFVEMGIKRECKIKGSPAHVWKLTERGTLFLRSRG